MMGCGKTTVGVALARRLALPFVDTDRLIEEEYGSIREIFARDGEARFREMETEVAQKLALQEAACVISVGGGFPLRKQNVELMKKRGVLVWLKADKQTLLGRLLGDTTRPLLQGEALDGKLEKLLSDRNPIYDKESDFAVDVADKSVEDIVEVIVGKLGLEGAGA